MVLSYPTMDMWRSVELALMMTLLFSVTLTSRSANSGGDWHAPDGTRVSGTDVPGFTRSRGPMVVRLGEISGTPLEGIYRCEMKDADDTLQTVYVGLYNAGAGRVINNTILCHCVPS